MYEYRLIQAQGFQICSNNRFLMLPSDDKVVNVYIIAD